MRRAIVLGLLQGPTEMAPVSSSAHTSLLQRRWRERSPSGRERAGCRYVAGEAQAAKHGRLEPRDASFRKSFEVALHAGTACALTLTMGAPLRRAFQRSCSDAGAGAQRARMQTLALSLVPPTLAGGLLERRIEQRLGGTRPIAVGLAAGAAAMALADRRNGRRTVEQVRPRDGFVLGLAQAAALSPGVSRRGATLAAARMLGFTRNDADALSWLTALPVIAGACTLKSLRLAGGQPLEEARRRALAAGAGASFLSTLASVWLLGRALRTAPLTPFCAYRIALALLVLACADAEIA